MTQRQIIVGDKPFHLMKLRQMRRVNRLVAEHAINAEIFARLEWFHLRQFVQSARRYRRGVCPQQILLRLALFPVVAPANRTIAAIGVRRLDSLHIASVFLCNHLRRVRLIEEERIVCIACWMLLWLKQRIKIPKRGLHVAIGLHLFKTHIQQDATHFSTHFHQRMKRAMTQRLSFGVEIVFLNLGAVPRITIDVHVLVNHLQRNILHLFFALR
mmetsp:Transcript_10987/g.16611  ORF Transcript_10987/g.16611 Transcript_10987/m.16611 type:complete len:214 (-) Transcript_10987:109-750(-)